MRYLLSSLALFLLSTSLSAQVRLGIKAGLTTTNLEVAQLSVPDGSGMQSRRLDIDEAKLGIQGGLVLQIPLGEKWIIQPELLFNSNEVEFGVEDFTGGAAIETIKSEKYQYVDLPLLFHYRLGPLRATAGPVGHLFVNSTSELTDFANYKERYEQLTYGYLVGGGLDIWNLMIDVRYEGNFTKFGDHFRFNGEQYTFDEEPARLIVTIGLLFGK
ncbi:MAG: outer membrane beta-barrel protein [Bacteroidetes bacterium]|jgi:hypothetical protein|nr:outer membrane beta-barrel protein [Bacteroidota bacterium]